MGLEAVTIAWIGAGLSAGGSLMQMSEQKNAQKSSQAAAREATAARGEEAAGQAKMAGQERRQQIREERVKRAQILNQAAQTGAAGSSGEAGAVGGMATQLGANLGSNSGSVMRGQRITGFLQNQANFQTQAGNQQAKANMWGQASQIGGSMFGQAGGWNTLFGKQGT